MRMWVFIMRDDENSFHHPSVKTEVLICLMFVFWGIGSQVEPYECQEPSVLESRVR